MEKTTETPYKRYNLKVCSEVFENSRRKKNEWKKVAVAVVVSISQHSEFGITFSLHYT